MFLPDYVLKGEDLMPDLGGGGFVRETPEQCQAGNTRKKSQLIS